MGWFKDWQQRRRERRELDARIMYGSAPRVDDGGFDVGGFMIGQATGVPIGPRGVTTEAIIGASMHQRPSDDDAPSCDSGGSDGGGSSC